MKIPDKCSEEIQCTGKYHDIFCLKPEEMSELVPVSQYIVPTVPTVCIKVKGGVILSVAHKKPVT